MTGVIILFYVALVVSLILSTVGVLPWAVCGLVLAIFWAVCAIDMATEHVEGACLNADSAEEARKAGKTELAKQYRKAMWYEIRRVGYFPVAWLIMFATLTLAIAVVIMLAIQEYLVPEKVDIEM